MSEGLDTLFFRLALKCAMQRDLSGAAACARRSMRINPENEKARRLLGICLYELGELDAAVKVTEGLADLQDTALAELSSTGETLIRVRELVDCRKWRKAEVLLRNIRHQSVRVLTMRGCAKAAAGHYRLAARLFARALEKDIGNQAARNYLMKVAGCKNRMINIYASKAVDLNEELL